MGEFKVGDRVKRLLKANGSVGPGTLGSVAKTDEKFVYVQWDGHPGPDWYVHEGGHFELHSPAQPPAPEWSASSVGIDWAAHSDARAQQQAQANYHQQGLGQHAAPGPCVNHVTHERALELYDKAVQSATVGLRSELADAKGERDRNASELDDARIRIAWLERELVRLSGRAKGAR